MSDSPSARIKALNQFEKRLEESESESQHIVFTDGKFGPKTTAALRYGKVFVWLVGILFLFQELKTMVKDDKAFPLLNEIDLRLEELKTVLREHGKES